MTETKAQTKPGKSDESVKPCKMSERCMQNAEIIANDWRVNAPAGARVEQMLEPSSWVHLAHKLHARDRIEVMPEDGLWLAEFVVLHKTDIGATLFLLQKWDLDTAIPDDDDTYEIKWQSPATKYAIFRKGDNEVVKNGFDSKALAEQWKVHNLQSKKVA